MYDVIGHSDVRARLASHKGSYALCGPAGVGRRGIAVEWTAPRPHQFLELTKDAVSQAVRRPDIVYIVELGRGPWTSLLRPLEEGTLTAVVLAENLPQPIRTRIPTFSVGWLPEINVTQILARDFTKLQPRHLLARMVQGTMCDIHNMAAAAKTFETLDRIIIDRKLPNRDIPPTVIFYGLRALCLSILDMIQLPVSDSLRGSVSPRLAWSFLKFPEPQTEYEARNAIQLFLGVRRG